MQSAPFPTKGTRSSCQLRFRPLLDTWIEWIRILSIWRSFWLWLTWLPKPRRTVKNTASFGLRKIRVEGDQCKRLRSNLIFLITEGQLFLFEGVASSSTSSNRLALDFLWTFDYSAFWTCYYSTFFPIVENEFIIISLRKSIFQKSQLKNYVHSETKNLKIYIFKSDVFRFAFLSIFLLHLSLTNKTNRIRRLFILLLSELASISLKSLTNATRYWKNHSRL